MPDYGADSSMNMLVLVVGAVLVLLVLTVGLTWWLGWGKRRRR